MSQQKASRGRGFTTTEVESLLEVIEEVLPIGQNEWDTVLHQHQSRYPDYDRTRDSIKRKFASLYNSKKPTGDPTCPPTVRRAKQLFNLIKEKMEFSDGQSMGSFAPSDVQPEEEEGEEEGAPEEDSQLNISNISESVASSTSKKRRVEGLQIRVPRARTSNEDDSMRQYMDFIIMKSEMDSKAHKERMELEDRREDRRERRHEKMMEMMMLSMMKSSSIESPPVRKRASPGRGSRLMNNESDPGQSSRLFQNESGDSDSE